MHITRKAKKWHNGHLRNENDEMELNIKVEICYVTNFPLLCFAF